MCFLGPLTSKNGSKKTFFAPWCNRPNSARLILPPGFPRSVRTMATKTLSEGGVCRKHGKSSKMFMSGDGMLLELRAKSCAQLRTSPPSISPQGTIVARITNLKRKFIIYNFPNKSGLCVWSICLSCPSWSMCFWHPDQSFIHPIVSVLFC